MENVQGILSTREKVFLVVMERARQLGLFCEENSSACGSKFFRRTIPLGWRVAAGRVLGDLACRGYDAVWTCLAASDVGAPHKRNRWWCLAWRADADNRAGGTECQLEQEERAEIPDRVCKETVGDDSHADRELREQSGTSWTTRWNEPANVRGREACEQLPHANSLWQPQQEGRVEDERGRPCDSYEQEIWQGLSKSGVDGMADGLANRMDPCSWWKEEGGGFPLTNQTENRVKRLKALGNGQVPLQAAAAFSILWNMMTEVRKMT
ncbi:MAG: hypothetical protein D6732_22115 [Methanobacteriota archaeon]|nr:MAG: hypothetical protein D6732_22115 [Euryarchaeota archaeon]